MNVIDTSSDFLNENAASKDIQISEEQELERDDS